VTAFAELLTIMRIRTGSTGAVRAHFNKLPYSSFFVLHALALDQPFFVIFVRCILLLTQICALCSSM
jgi:hypothetical protein